MPTHVPSGRFTPARAFVQVLTAAGTKPLAIFFAQRPLWKSEDNIFTNTSRQVREILAVQLLVEYEFIYSQRHLKRLHTSAAAQSGRGLQRASDQQGIPLNLYKKIVLDLMLESYVGFIQFHNRTGLATGQRLPLRGNAFDVDLHNYLRNLCSNAFSTPRGTKSLTFPPKPAISRTNRELINVYSSFGIKKIVSIRESNLRFIKAI